ncbi:mycothiol synthase [Actinomadura barringtoniae]|uniref:Mycothiol acetyltransferase n=1 Tax=Actinomadura barringtoniae TaxID=1427535 RepID=A0A939TC79_9ACTN|nr:mycothiol synthase [Actinomadura barringtoniae]MBO2454282.1 mycothiol synthase [Actinomadura barringtoniae]
MADVQVRSAESPVPAAEADEIAALVDAATAADGVGPLSEASRLWLRNGGGAARGLVLRENGENGEPGNDGELVAYAHFDPATEEESAAGELVVHPDKRRRGHGRTLLRALLTEANGPFRVWAHGDLPAAAALAEAEGMERVRALFQMRRPAADPLPDMKVADGVALRTFRVGQDEDAWLEVNRRAFADHPEQGAWTITDVLQRENERWFDPRGLFLAESERDGNLLGFHWTKIHPDGFGEVYVVGVDPASQGLGLGRTLTLAGLRFLQSKGVPQILLYVDESNVSAVKLYESLGFTRHAVDVMYGASTDA